MNRGRLGIVAVLFAAAAPTPVLAQQAAPGWFREAAQAPAGAEDPITQRLPWYAPGLPAAPEGPAPQAAGVNPWAGPGTSPATPATPVPTGPQAATPIGPETASPAPAVPAAAAPAPSAFTATTLSPAAFVAAANGARTAATVDLSEQSPLVARLQVLLDRAGASPGVIDGYFGDNVAKAVRAFEQMRGLPIDGVPDEAVWNLLESGLSAPPFTTYTIGGSDVAGPYYPNLPSDYAALARLDRVGYHNAAEDLAERFHMSQGFLQQLNPGASFAPGSTIRVADTGRNVSATVVHLIADKSAAQLLGFDASGRLVVAYPATIGGTDTPSPTGMHRVDAVALDAEYWYRPDVNFVQGNNRSALRIPPGPNNPIGGIWIDLSEPTYGIHGTPDPNRISKSFSHGCVRLTNWDAAELARMVVPGTLVEFVDGHRSGGQPALQALPPVAPVDTAPLVFGTLPGG